MPTEITIAEKPAASGAAQMRAADRAAEDRANTPVKLWTPAPPPPRPASVLAKLEEAADLRVQGEQLNAQADSIAMRARLTEQRIASLLREKTELVNRIATIERRDLAAEKAQATATFNSKYGGNLTADEVHGLSQTVIFIGSIPTLERLTPPLVKLLRAQLEKINAELAAVTGAQ